MLVRALLTTARSVSAFQCFGNATAKSVNCFRFSRREPQELHMFRVQIEPPNNIEGSDGTAGAPETLRCDEEAAAAVRRQRVHVLRGRLVTAVLALSCEESARRLCAVARMGFASVSSRYCTNCRESCCCLLK